MRNQGRGVAAVDVEPGLDGLGRVVGAPFLRRPGGHAVDQDVLVHVEQEDVVQAVAALGQGAVHHFRLGGGAREAVEDRPVLGLGLRELALDQVENDGVGDELPLVVELLGLLAEGRTVLHRGAQDVARRDLGEPQTLRQDLALGPLA
jgi:hypothetical protein